MVYLKIVTNSKRKNAESINNKEGKIFLILTALSE